MNQNQDFSEFVKSLQAIINNGREEAKAPKGSLERMRFSAIRQGKVEEAVRIAEFLDDVAREITFFRKASHIVASDIKRSWADWLPSVKRPITPATFEKIDLTLSQERPFQCYEGVFKTQDEASSTPSSANLKGPYFLAVAANFSGAVDLPKGNLVCLFSQAAKREKDRTVELRIWGAPNFRPLFSGKSFDQTSLSVPPDSNETILEFHKGNLPQLFRIAVTQMVRASLSKDPPKNVAEQWFTLLAEYSGNAPEPQALK
ncbi:MAG: hypothetical protein A3B66_05095 [Alphaproteobacteria bacterium RIFCSPHIGHO2_02_FULL_46_13]|nr:MAG: hypothetical protein A3B66_05095 [Alphaproteobacteria bacterium RIFCSPHIGHO2_02_FULL_46_13]